MRLLRLLATERVVEEGSWGSPFLDGIKNVLLIVFVVVGVVAVAYAIFLGFLLAKAEDEGKRKQAKKRILNTIAGLFAILILTMFIVTDGMGVLKDTKEIVLYTLEQDAFTTNQVNAGNATLKLYRNSVVVSDNVTFEKKSGDSGISINSNTGKISATTTGSINVSVKVQGDVKIEDRTVYIRSYVSQAPVEVPSGNTNEAITDYPENNDYYNSVIDTNASFWCPADYTDTDGGRTAFGTNILVNVSSSFGPRMLGGKYDFHLGVDLYHAGTNGRKIYAARIGKVITVVKDQSASTSGYGNYIIVEHTVNGTKYRTLYAHLLGNIPSSLHVGSIVGGKPGDTYEGLGTSFPYGTAIAYMGTTGNSTGVHLHFEIPTTDSTVKYIDPKNGSKYGTSRTQTAVSTASPAYTTFFK